jgi:hypothetical protein
MSNIPSATPIDLQPSRVSILEEYQSKMREQMQAQFRNTFVSAGTLKNSDKGPRVVYSKKKQQDDLDY